MDERISGRLELTALGPLRVLERIASGKVTTVYRAELDGHEVALKIFKPRSIRRHATRHALNIAEFEFERNRAFAEAPGLGRYAAVPIGFIHTPGISAMVQELVDGELYYDASRRRGGPLPQVFDHIRRIVELAHACELYDLDLHAMNVFVVNEGGEQLPRLFDFNRIPFYQHPRNPLEAFALKAGIIDRGSRDRRKLRQFHDFEHLERRRGRGISPEGDGRTGGRGSLVPEL